MTGARPTTISRFTNSYKTFNVIANFAAVEGRRSGLARCRSILCCEPASSAICGQPIGSELPDSWTLASLPVGAIRCRPRSQGRDRGSMIESLATRWGGPRHSASSCTGTRIISLTPRSVDSLVLGSDVNTAVVASTKTDLIFLLAVNAVERTLNTWALCRICNDRAKYELAFRALPNNIVLVAFSHGFASGESATSIGCCTQTRCHGASAVC